MPEDIAFLRALQERPDDDTTRLVYADWLEEQGGEQNATRAAFLRAECERASLPEEDQRREALQTRLRQLVIALPIVWRAAVSKARIEKCAVEFELECPKQWDQLRPIGFRSERYCDTCRQMVHYCSSKEEVLEHADYGNCIAIDAAVVVQGVDLDREVLMGLIRPPRSPAWDKPDAEEVAHE